MFKYKIETWLLLLTAMFFLTQCNFIKPQLIGVTDYLPPPLEIKYLTGGFAAQMSDVFWLRSVQDTQYCEENIDEKTCTGKSWFFNVINLVVELEPNFSEAYYYGGLSLTVLISDYEGASVIFDKGTAMFKYEWPMLYLAAYHALFEEKNKTKAAKLYLKAADNGAPPWVRLSAGKLAAEGGELDSAEEILQQLIKSESNPKWIARLKEKLKKSKNNENAAGKIQTN